MKKGEDTKEFFEGMFQTIKYGVTEPGKLNIEDPIHDNLTNLDLAKIKSVNEADLDMYDQLEANIVKEDKLTLEDIVDESTF